mgnify:FL=1|jgi:hypothetical protein
MKDFVRCRGKAYCREAVLGCGTCGRSHAEIEATRVLITAAADFVLIQGYDNVDEFASYLAEKIRAKVRYARDNR